MLTNILFKMLDPVAGSYGIILVFAKSILYYLLTIEIILMGIYWALDIGNIVAESIRKILTTGFLVFVIFQFPYFHKMLMDSAISVGLIAGGGTITTAQFANPSYIFDIGLKQAVLVQSKIHGIFDFSGESLLLGLCALGIVVSYIVVAVQIMATFLEFYILSVLSVFLLPFGVFRPTLFIAEKSFGMMVGFAIKLLVLGFIVSLFTPIANSLDVVSGLHAGVTYRGAFEALAAALFFLWISWQIPSMAASLLTGGPSLTAGSFFSTATAATAGVAVGAGAAFNAIRMAGQASVGATQVASAAITGAQLGAATSTGGFAAKVGGAAKGAASTAVNSVAQRVTSSYKQAVDAGRVGAFAATGGTVTPGMQQKMAQGNNSGGHGGGRPSWAQSVMQTGHLARMVMPNESSPHGSSHAPLR